MCHRDVLCSSDLLQAIVSFQQGVPEDMVPLVQLQVPEPPVRDGCQRWCQNLKETVSIWYKEHGAERLPRLFAVVPTMRRNMVLFAVVSGDLALLRLLQMIVCKSPDTLTDLAASVGQLKALIYLHASGAPLRSSAMITAAAHGHLDVVRHMDMNWPGASDLHRAGHLLEAAASHGHLKVVEYLMARKSTYTTVAMDLAAGGGHLDVVKYLHKVCPEGCTRQAIDLAASNGHLDVIEWLHDNRKEGWSHDAVAGAAKHGHLNVLEYLLDHKPRIGCLMYAMDDAATNGHFNIVQFLHTHRDEGCTDAALAGARRNGHTEIVKYLEIHGNDLIHRICCVCGFYKPRNHYCAPLERIRMSSVNQE